MLGVWLIAIGLVVILFAVYLNKKMPGSKMFIPFICIGVLFAMAGVLLFCLVAFDVIAFPLR